MQKHTIGFIGVGNMGWPMAARIAQAGFDLCAADADAARALKFAEANNARTAELSAEFARSCRVVITMLPTSAVVDQVLFAPEFASGLQPGTLIVEMSSGVPSHTVQLAKKMQAKGVRLIDAPVSGGVKRAESGELAIMVGGEQKDLDVAMPLLKAMGANITRTGNVGTAHAMKALNNLVCAATFVATSEALVIGKTFGLDPGTMVDVLNSSSGMNFNSQRKFKQFVLSGQFNSGFGLDLMVKDVGIAMDLAQQTRTLAPLSSACHRVWEAARNLLGSGQDHTAVARVSGMLASAALEAAI